MNDSGEVAGFLNLLFIFSFSFVRKRENKIVPTQWTVGKIK